MPDNSVLFPELGTVYRNSSGNVSKLSHNVANISRGSREDPNCKFNPWDSHSGVTSNPQIPHNSASNAWERPNLIQKLGIQKNGCSGSDNSNMWPTQTTVGNAWPKKTNEAWRNNFKASQLSASPTSDKADEIISNAQSSDFICAVNGVDDDNDDEEEDLLYDSDDDFFDIDSDSDTSQKSHENLKKCMPFKAFFECLEKLTVDEINSPARRWHCPACQGGPGAINWYRALQPLIAHAQTKKKRRALLHREFAKLLNEETCRRGISGFPVGEVFDRWEGLSETVKDHEIVWPPMVIVMNTRNEQHENGKWSGMGNQDLLDCFCNYAASKARHSYGPQGHRGMSVLIFEYSAAGYMEAVHLHKHFKEQGRDREAWDRSQVLFSGGKRQLYGFMAMKEDLDIFNQHARGRSKLQFEMRSYQQMVGSQINQMNDNSQQLIQLKDKFVEGQKHSQVLAESIDRVSEKLRQTIEENRLIRQRMKLQREETKDEMDAQERFFKDQMKIIQEVIKTKEDTFKKMQQAEQEKVQQSDAHNSNVGHREEEIASLQKLKEREWEEFETEREKIIKDHEGKKAATMRRYWDEQLELKKELEKELTLLMEKYSPTGLRENSTNNL